MRVIQHLGGVALHLKEVVFVFPDKWDILELLDIIFRSSISHHWRLRLLLVRQQEIIDQLLPPLNDASDHVQGEHPERVEDVDALVQKLRV